jgi:phosphoribosylamine--glycine ligase
MKKVIVFGSGNGSNFEAIVRYFQNKSVEFLCVSDKKDAFILERAKKFGIQTYYVPFLETYEFLINHPFDLVVLAGYMKVLPKKVIELGKFINIHPSLLPAYKGKDVIKRAYEANEQVTGVTVHNVNEEVDSGKIIAQIPVTIEKNMTLEALEEKIHETEHFLYPKVIDNVLFPNKKTGLKVLLYGGGAREHALAYKISLSSRLSKLYLCNPNDGFLDLGEVIKADNYESLAKIAKEKDIDLLVVGPENPLAEGIVDEFKKLGIPSIGVDKKWAALESSKSFAKNFMIRNNLPTARFETITSTDQIQDTLDKFNLPVVIKADGLAAGKGVQIIMSKEEAQTELHSFLSGKYGEASKKIVVEEFLAGEEISLISLWDGQTLLPLIPARDYKRLLDNNEGPNTGGMGAYCPVKLTSKEELDIKEYLSFLESALKKEKADFTGIIYSGLMMTKDGVKVLEYNMRFGDPETQALMIHLETDLLEIFEAAISKKLDAIDLRWKTGTSTCLVIAANGYPYNPQNGSEIKNSYEISEKYGINIFYAGIKRDNSSLIANGGRILSICKTNAKNDIYAAANELIYDDKCFRNDIGAEIDERACNYSRV